MVYQVGDFPDRMVIRLEISPIGWLSGYTYISLIGWLSGRKHISLIKWNLLVEGWYGAGI
jgi:hypothetical protein